VISKQLGLDFILLHQLQFI